MPDVIRFLYELEMKKNRGIWSWPGDGLAWLPWQYYIHWDWVSAWNAENRQTECHAFLRNWLASDDNINNALQKWREFAR